MMIQTEGVTKKIKFIPGNNQSEENNFKDESIEFQMRINLKNIGISFVGYLKNKKRTEIGFLSI